MILSITPNTAIDYTLRVPKFILGRTIRAVECAWGMGGKAADASWILGHWGIKTHVLGFAAGQNGHRMDAMLRARGCDTDFVWVDGETRLNIVLCEGGDHSTFTSSTLDVKPSHLESIYEKYREVLTSVNCVIVGGSLPNGVPVSFFKEIISFAREKDLPVIFDSSGPALKSGLVACPTVIKPNLTELLDLADSKLARNFDAMDSNDRIKTIYNLAQRVHARYDVNVVSTFGKEGALAIFEDNHYWIPPLNVDVVSAAGAGDAILAGLAVAYAGLMTIVDGLHLGFALANAVLLSTATADYSIDDARKFLKQTVIQSISPGFIFNPGKAQSSEKR